MAGLFLDGIRAAGQRAKAGLRRATVYALAGLRVAWQHIRPPLSFTLQVLAALILLFEEWGWRPLVDALAYLSRFRIVARLELVIAGLPPYGALAALALPTSILFPLKLLAVYLVANGKLFAASLLFVGAKIASTALIARLFLLTKPSLMQIGWFALSPRSHRAVEGCAVRKDPCLLGLALWPHAEDSSAPGNEAGVDPRSTGPRHILGRSSLPRSRGVGVAQTRRRQVILPPQFGCYQARSDGPRQCSAAWVMFIACVVRAQSARRQ